MSITMHSASVPVFVHMLSNLSKWIDKAEAHAKAKKFDPAVLLAARLAPDMLAFTKQVQIGCDAAKFGVARLAGIAPPKQDDNETSLSELQERITATINFLHSVPAEQVDGCEDKDITVPRMNGSMVMKAEAYLKHYALPNFFFHITTAYALLRHNGVELGKADFLAR